MPQAADERPDPSLHRKAAIVHGAALDHTGHVTVRSIPDFDLDRTIFQTLEGKAARFIMKSRVGKEVHWADPKAEEVHQAYTGVREQVALPAVAPELMDFLVTECDFDVEHADGSFLDHLYFCFEYGVSHYREQSPLVLLLHSILGTGTNTFAMDAAKIPQLRALLSDVDWTHTEAFPSALRLLYDGRLRQELRENKDRTVQRITMHRVIDNAPLTLSGEDLWIQLNYQLIHLVDFLPVSNWSVHQNDTSFILFRDLYALLQECGQLQARIGYTPAGPRGEMKDEHLPFLARMATRIPIDVTEKLAAKSVRKFSDRCGHSLDYQIDWA